MKHTIEDICEFFKLEAILDDDGMWRLHGNDHLIDQVEIPTDWVEDTTLTKYTPSSIIDDPRHSIKLSAINKFFGAFGCLPGTKFEWHFSEVKGSKILNDKPSIIIPHWPGADIIDRD